MITDLLLSISHFVVSVIDHLGYLGVILLMAIESAAIPLPSEIIMPFSGSLIGNGRFTLLGLGLAGALGSSIGSLTTYYLGYYGGRKLIQKYERYVFVSEGELSITEKFFQKFPHYATLIGRVLPVVRTFISIPAGIAKVPVIPFTIYAFLGSFVWSYFLAFLGLKFGENWKILENYFRKFDIIILIVAITLIFWWVYKHVSGVDRNKQF